MASPRLWSQTASIDDVSRESDGQGGWTRSYGPELAAGLPCKFDALSGSETMIAGGGERAEVTHRMFIATDAPVAAGRRVRISTGEVAEIVSVLRPGGSPLSFDPHLEVGCRRVEAKV